MTCSSIAELVEYSVTISLLHLGMYVETGISQLGYLLGKELDTINRVTEDDRLVNFQLRE